MNHKFSDCNIILNDKSTVPAHRFVLAARSPVFNSILSSDFQERSTATLSLDTNAEDAKVLMEYIYKGTATITNDTALGLYLLADKYQFPALREACFQFMRKNLTPENVCQVFRETGHPDLEDVCARFFGRLDIESVAYPSFITLSSDDIFRLISALQRVYHPHPEYLFRIAWRWAYYSPEERIKCPKWSPFLKELDVPMLSPCTLIGKVKDVVSPDEYTAILERALRGREHVPSVDFDGFPNTPLLRYGCVQECPIPMVEARVMKYLKDRIRETVPFRELVRDLSGLDNCSMVVHPNSIRQALAELVQKRFIEADGVGFYQYRA